MSNQDDGECSPAGGGQAKTYEQIAKEGGMIYTICDVPPLGTSLLLGVQHYLTMLGATVLVPLLLTPAMGASQEQTAEVIATCFLTAGINTLIQTSIGDRLPIVQGGSFSFLPATFSIIFSAELQAIEDNNERFLETMRVIQGSIIVVGILQMGKFLFCTGQYTRSRCVCMCTMLLVGSGWMMFEDVVHSPRGVCHRAKGYVGLRECSRRLFQCQRFSWNAVIVLRQSEEE